MKVIERRNKKLVIFIIALMLGTAIQSVMATTETLEEKSQTLTFCKEFSTPELKDKSQHIEVLLEEANSYTIDPEVAKLPTFNKVFEFPAGTKINKVSCKISSVKEITINKNIELRPSIQSLYNEINLVKIDKNEIKCPSSKPYPSSWYDYEKGTGLNKNGERVLYLSVNINPVRYLPVLQKIQYVNKIELTIEYDENPSIKTTSTNQYDLVIITPSEFCDDLQPLVDHKNTYNIKTNLTTLDEIYGHYPGRDDAEQIKYFIKQAIDEWGVKYVLLIGDIYKLPIRAAYSHLWSDWEGHILSDLYYADIYDENDSFCSWDANENSIFGEVEYNASLQHYKADNIDEVDLYPDVCIGRLPCSTCDEVRNVVEKIITYEERTYDQIWFKKIVLAGGDTFPPSKHGIPFVYEGEITNIKVAQQLPDFEHIKLWTSKHDLNAITFNREINKGVGFVSYAGHGFEFGWGTYRPNSIREKMGITQPLYYTPYIKSLRNIDRLPVIFFDACLTAKLDFTFEDIINYKPWSFLEILTRLPNIYKEMRLPCFAWAFVKHDEGGAIATIGATRSAYTHVDENGVYAGAGYLDVHFFKAYEEGTTLGEMFLQAKNDYINYVGKDFFTIEEFILIGDPSLIVGGYP